MNLKKAYFNCKGIIFNTILVCFFLFNSSCGLDTYYIVEPPYFLNSRPSYDNHQITDQTFYFTTNEVNNNNNEGCMFLGTNVYYKIYSDSSKMTTEVNNLIAISNDDEKNSELGKKLHENYLYQQLRIQNANYEPLIQNTDTNVRVRIRLTDYGNSNDFPDYVASIEINDMYIGFPVRNNGTANQYTFNFGRNGENDRIPIADDKDFSNSGSNTDGKYYVAMFAVSEGQIATFERYYSNILFLGTVTIDSHNTDN